MSHLKHAAHAVLNAVLEFFIDWFVFVLVCVSQLVGVAMDYNEPDVDEPDHEGREP